MPWRCTAAFPTGERGVMKFMPPEWLMGIGEAPLSAAMWRSILNSVRPLALSGMAMRLLFLIAFSERRGHGPLDEEAQRPFALRPCANAIEIRG